MSGVGASGLRIPWYAPARGGDGARRTEDSEMASLSDLLFSAPAPWFTVPALIGTGGYLFKLVFGMGEDDGGVGGDAGGLEGGAAASDIGSTALSLHGLFTFLMGFGWGGLVCLHAFEWSMIGSAAGGFAAGCGFIGIVIVVMRAGRRLQSSGNIGLAELVGNEGEVYSAIPAAGQGVGRVRTVLGDRERFVSASSTGEGIASRTRVVIERVNGDNSVLVRPADGGRTALSGDVGERKQP